ncbi:MAG: type 4a pilus biogenesis protein PilO [Pseudomonadota bacterium]
MNAALLNGPRRQFVLLVVGAALLIIAALASFVLAPQMRRLAAAQKDAPESVASSGRTVADQLSDQDAVLVALSQRLDGGNGVAPKQLEAYLVDRLQATAAQRSLEITGLRPTRGQTVDAFREVGVQLAVQGDYVNIARWLDAISLGDDAVVLKELRINRAPVTPDDPSSTDNPGLEAELTLASYQLEPTS